MAVAQMKGMFNEMKKICSLLIAAALVVGMLPAAAMATEKNFTDTAGHWGEEAITYAVERGLFQGTGGTSFSPDLPMDRGMFVTVLGRFAALLGHETAGGVSRFADVTDTAYYAGYVAWAADNKIIMGGSDNLFHPSESITREQMCVILVRFLKDYAHYDLTAYQGGGSFLDSAEISNYAMESVAIAQAMGLIQGSPAGAGMEFAPRDISTRAAVAAVFQRLDQVIETKLQKPDGNPEGKPSEPGNGSSGGGETDKPGDVPTEEEKAEEREVAGYLAVIVENYKKSDYLPTTEPEVQACMSILINCIEDALSRRTNGAFLSRAYIASTYDGEIRELQAAHDALTDTQSEQLYNVVVRLETTEHITLVMDYFGVSADF